GCERGLVSYHLACPVFLPSASPADCDVGWSIQTAMQFEPTSTGCVGFLFVCNNCISNAGCLRCNIRSFVPPVTTGTTLLKNTCCEFVVGHQLMYLSVPP